MQEPAQSASTNAATQTGAPAPSIEPDAAIVSSLIDMGFSENGSKRAAAATKVLTLHPLPSSALLSRGEPDTSICNLKPLLNSTLGRSEQGQSTETLDVPEMLPCSR